MSRARQRRRHPRRGRLLRAVLRPARGRRLPHALRPARVGRLAAAVPGGLADPAFATLLQRIDAAPMLGGHAVEVYFHGEHAFAAMREAIRAARGEVLLETYILRGDRTGRAFLEELAAAVG